MLLLAFVPAASGRIIFVDDDATGNNNGSSWADAYNYLQDALIVASNGDEIWVAEGVYKPDQKSISPPIRGRSILSDSASAGDRTATFQLKNGVALYGGFANGQTQLDQRNPEAHPTILSGDLNGDDGPNFANNGENSYHVVTGSGTNNTAVLDGFTITAGNADGTIQQSFSECGGGMYNSSGSPNLINCKFFSNQAQYGGGGMFNIECSSPSISNCTFSGNSAQLGGGMLNFVESSPSITNCIFSGNHASSSGGGLNNEGECNPTLTNCKIIGNIAGVEYVSYGFGGGMSNRNGCNPILINCIITGNSAKGDSQYGGGGGIYNWNLDITSSPTLVNCTFAGNSAPRGRSLSCDLYFDGLPSNVQLTNCIIWDSGNKIWNNDGSVITITHSDVKGGFAGEGNINIDPSFVDADGADNIFGTEDDDLRLLPDSPCIDTGNNLVVPGSVRTDLDGNLRIMNQTVDMGAYEFRGPMNLYVDVFNGDDNNDGLSPDTAFATIQKCIDAAEDGDAVLVYPGIYREEINFLGKAITVQDIATKANIAVLENPGDFAVSFYNGEGPDSILKNFVIRNSFMAIFIAGSSPTISNVTAVDNKYGIEAYAGAQPDISNSIFWNNAESDLFGCKARYSCIEVRNRGEGQGNISINPSFADPANNDYHLLSKRGRYWPRYDIWVLDKKTSLCVDRGDPTAYPLDEPIPNGGRINMGAYGGTAYASMSERLWLDGDINHDLLVNMMDLAILAENWLNDELPSPNLPPQVSITEPPDGARFAYGTEEIQIEADASDDDGFVVKVEFFVNGVKIDEDNEGSDGWMAYYKKPRTGTHILTAKATDDDGAITTSPSTTVVVQSRVR